MANDVTLSDLRTRAKNRADMASSSFVSDAEWKDYINEGISELHDIIVANYENQIITSKTVSLVAGTDTYVLPSDVYKVVGMDYETGSQRYTLRRFMWAERNRYRQTILHSGVDVFGGPYYEYSLEGNNFRMIPLPSSSATIRIWYVPQCVNLSLDTDVVNYTVVRGWEQFIILTSAIKALAKEETDTTTLQNEKAELKQRLVLMSAQKDISEPARVYDVDDAYTRRWTWR